MMFWVKSVCINNPRFLAIEISMVIKNNPQPIIKYLAGLKPLTYRTLPSASKVKAIIPAESVISL